MLNRRARRLAAASSSLLLVNDPELEDGRACLYGGGGARGAFSRRSLALFKNPPDACITSFVSERRNGVSHICRYLDVMRRWLDPGSGSVRRRRVPFDEAAELETADGKVFFTNLL